MISRLLGVTLVGRQFVRQVGGFPRVRSYQVPTVGAVEKREIRKPCGLYHQNVEFREKTPGRQAASAPCHPRC